MGWFLLAVVGVVMEFKLRSKRPSIDFEFPFPVAF